MWQHGKASSTIRTLARLRRSRGANRGANGHRRRAASGDGQLPSVQFNSSSGHAQHRPPTCWKCLLSSRSQVRILLGALTREYVQYERCRDLAQRLATSDRKIASGCRCAATGGSAMRSTWPRSPTSSTSTAIAGLLRAESADGKAHKEGLRALKHRISGRDLRGVSGRRPARRGCQVAVGRRWGGRRSRGRWTFGPPLRRCGGVC